MTEASFHNRRMSRENCGTQAQMETKGGIMATTTQAKPLERRETSNLIGSDKVEGTPVCRPDGERVGQIERIMIDKLSGKVAYAVMSCGGVFWKGGSQHPVSGAVLNDN